VLIGAWWRIRPAAKAGRIGDVLVRLAERMCWCGTGGVLALNQMVADLPIGQRLRRWWCATARRSVEGADDRARAEPAERHLN